MAAAVGECREIYLARDLYGSSSDRFSGHGVDDRPGHTGHLSVGLGSLGWDRRVGILRISGLREAVSQQHQNWPQQTGVKPPEIIVARIHALRASTSLCVRKAATLMVSDSDVAYQVPKVT